MPRKLLIIIVIVCWTVIYARQSQVNPLMHDVATFELNMQHTFTIRAGSGHMGEIELKIEKYYKIPARIGLVEADAICVRALFHIVQWHSTALDSFAVENFRNAIISPTTGTRHKLCRTRSPRTTHFIPKEDYFLFSSHSPARSLSTVTRAVLHILHCIFINVLCVHYIFKLNSTRTI